MMQIVVIAVILGYASCAHLNNAYLPPVSQSSSFGGAAAAAAGAGAGASFGAGAGGAAAAVFGATFGAGAAAQAYSSANVAKQIPIVKFASENEGEGTYRYNYESANSIAAEEQGDTRSDGTKAHGSFSYTAPDGQHVSVIYTADENGFVPQGSHIPTAPPVPEAILKALQENAAAEARGIFDDGQYHGEGENEGQYHGEGQGAAVELGRNAGSSAVAASRAYLPPSGGYRY